MYAQEERVVWSEGSIISVPKKENSEIQITTVVISRGNTTAWYYQYMYISKGIQSDAIKQNKTDNRSYST